MVAASNLDSPNGTVITADRATLLADEHHTGRVSAFTIGDDGSLHDQRTSALAADWLPDGCCLDAEGAMWIASTNDPLLRPLAHGGKVIDTVEASQPAFACVLAGADRRTLCISSTPGSDDADRDMMAGRVETMRVDVPGAG